MGKIIISTSVTSLDWFDTRNVEIGVEKFDYFTLESTSLLWTLKCWKRKFEKCIIIESHELSTEQNISKLIDELDIREIKSSNTGCNRSVKSLFKDYLANR